MTSGFISTTSAPSRASVASEAAGCTIEQASLAISREAIWASFVSLRQAFLAGEVAHQRIGDVAFAVGLLGVGAVDDEAVDQAGVMLGNRARGGR